MGDWVNTGIRMNIDGDPRVENYAYFRTHKNSQKSQALENLLGIYLQNIYLDGCAIEVKKIDNDGAKVEITLTGLEFDLAEQNDE